MAYNPLDPDGDPFRPPAIPTLVGCLHCQEEYDSYKIEWRVSIDADGKRHGFWCCPTPGCGGCGFGFDIFPVDSDYRDENGDRMCVSADEEDDDEFDEDDDLPLDGEMSLDPPGPDAHHGNGNGKVNGPPRPDDDDDGIPF